MSDNKVNRGEVTFDDGTIIGNIYSTHFVQDPTLDRNTDVQNTIDLYYTDLDTKDENQLYMSPGDAQTKAKNLSHLFPNHIVKMFMFYYEPNTNQTSYTRKLCQVVPGIVYTKDERFRIVKRKNLKSIYDKIDFILVYRPKNRIKWYTVSKEELNEELAVIRSFYGLTNFPDKVGDFYFSKKIGRWLVTNEFNEIVSKYYAGNVDSIPVFYPDENEDSPVIPAKQKTWYEILADWFGEGFARAGEVVEAALSPIKDIAGSLWEDIMGLFKDEDQNWIPDTLEKFFAGDTALIATIQDIINENNNKVEGKIKDINDLFGLDSNTKNLTGLFNNLNGYKGDLHDIIESLKGQGSNWWSNWWTSIVTGWKNILNKLGISQ